MDYDETKIRQQVIAGLRAEPWQVELEQIDHGVRLGVFYRSPQGIKRVIAETVRRNEDQIAFDLLSQLMNKPIDIAPALYEGRAGRHPDNCTCSKHKAVNGAQAA